MTGCNPVSVGSIPTHAYKLLIKRFLSRYGYCGGLKNHRTWFDPRREHHGESSSQGAAAVLKTECTFTGMGFEYSALRQRGHSVNGSTLVCKTTSPGSSPGGLTIFTENSRSNDGFVFCIIWLYDYIRSLI